MLRILEPFIFTSGLQSKAKDHPLFGKDVASNKDEVTGAQNVQVSLKHNYVPFRRGCPTGQSLLLAYRFPGSALDRLNIRLPFSLLLLPLLTRELMNEEHEFALPFTS